MCADGLFIPMFNVLCGPQSAAPYHILPRLRCLYLAVGVLKSFVISRNSLAVLGSDILSPSLEWWHR